MNEAKTSDAREHYPILDGLRGTAAMLVVVFHLMESIAPDESANLMRHGYLAVDFFFALSGYVMGYAYDRRGSSLTAWHFIKARLIRLHPVVVIGGILGAIAYYVDPFPSVIHAPAIGAGILAMIAAILLIPSWTLPDRGTDYFPYNGVFWTLFFEYIANLAYYFILRHMSKKWLAVLATIAAGILVWRATAFDTIHLGYDWRTLQMAPVRLAYQFIIGLLLQRTIKVAPFKLGWLSLSLVLLAAFAAPWFVDMAGLKMNGLYDAAIVILVFPLILAAGAHAIPHGWWSNLCTQLGRVSYPLYGTHYALVYVYADWIAKTKPSQLAILVVGIATWIGAQIIAWTVVFLWDEPIRNYLGRKFLMCGRRTD